MPRLAPVAVALVLSVFSIAALDAPAAHAGALTCAQLEWIGGAFNEQIVAKLDEEAAGHEYRINRRKTLVIDEVSSVRVRGCEVTVEIDVTLERKLLRDLHGTVTAKATIAASALSGNRLELRFEAIRVTDVAMGLVGEVREAIFTWVANRVLPDRETIAVDLSDL